jgi:hypothetical protein
MLKRLAVGGILVMLAVVRMACSRDSGSPTNPEFNPTSGFWSTRMNFQENEKFINTVFFNVSDDGKALYDFTASCGDASGAYGMNPIETIPISGTTFNTTISGDDTKVTIVKLPYNIKISGRFSSAEIADVTIEWGDVYSCTQRIKLNDSCFYSVGESSVNVSCAEAE